MVVLYLLGETSTIVVNRIPNQVSAMRINVFKWHEKLNWWHDRASIYLADSRKTKMQMPMVEPKRGLQMQTGMKESAKIKVGKLKSNTIFLP